MPFGRLRRYSAKEEAQGRAFGILLGTLGGGPLLLFLAKHHYGQLAETGRIVTRSKRGVATLIAGRDAYWMIGAETLVGAILLMGGLWWVRERLRRFPH